MKIYLECDDSFTRPVVGLHKVFNGCKGLIDTGALFPVWTAPEEVLVASGAQFDPEHSPEEVTGFGGTAKGNLYRMNLDLNGIYYIDLPILASELSGSRFHMILPSSMFAGMELVLDYKNHCVNIDTRSNQVVYHLHHKRDDGGTLVLING